MGYGGPRFEFHTANAYANHAAAIRREENASVRAIVERDRVAATVGPQAGKAAERALQERREREAREKQEAAEAEEAELRRLRRRAERERRALAAGKKIPTPAERAAYQARQEHTDRLARPKDYGEAQYGGTMYGRVMHQRGHTVEFPEGRNHTAYMPGVDRHRVVPGRPDLRRALPPWTGSHSTHHTGAGREAKEKREHDRYYLGGGGGDPAAAAQRRAMIDEIEHQQQLSRSRREQQQMQQQQQGQDEGDGARARGLAMGGGGGGADGSDSESDAPSVFSHGSSNAPVRALGLHHMSDPATKPEASEHLRSWNGLMSAPRSAATQPVDYDALSRPELVGRLARMQKPPPRLRTDIHQ